MPPEKESPHKMYRPFWHSEDNEGDTNENKPNTDDSRYDNDGFVKKTWAKNKIINKMIDTKKILLWLIKQMNLKVVNLIENKHILNSC